MKRIIKGIIHLLGGITVEENGENQVNCHELGSYFTAYRIRQYMRSLNGRPPEEWCRMAYDMVDGLIRDMEAKEEDGQ